jgi:hypothetical protein
MVQLGFYQNETELLRLIEPIISLLDGSNDFHSPEEEEAFNAFLRQNELENSVQPKKGRVAKKVIMKRDKTIRY